MRTYSEWMYPACGSFNGIREDTLNVEIMRYLKAALESQGATVIQLREFDPNARHRCERISRLARGRPAIRYRPGFALLDLEWQQ